MQPDIPPSSTKPTAPRSSALRYAVALGLLVAFIGAIAWVAQFLPSWNKKKQLTAPPVVARLLEFPRSIAQWDKRKPLEPKDDADITKVKDDEAPQEVEFGTEGHYDFPFKNISGQEVELVGYESTCDCTSVRACNLPMADWAAIAEQQKLKPGDPFAYAVEPAWQDLRNGGQKAAEGQKPVVKVQAGEGGVVRVRWTVKKAPGQPLRLNPRIWFRQTGDSVFQWQDLGVPVTVGTPIRFDPPRSPILYLAPGSLPAKAEFKAWSSTRDKFALKLTTAPASPFFDIESKPLTEKECAELAANLKSEKFSPRVRSGYHVTVTVHESKDGKQLDQGPFYQKLAIELDGVPERELSGPEIVGRVQGDIRIGGTDDQGKINFKELLPGQPIVKTVELLADAKVTLEPYTHEPAWLQVTVTRNKEQLDPKKHIWRLQVTIPANTPGVRSFEETDHVTLRIVGPPDRFVRIALYGNVSRQ